MCFRQHVGKWQRWSRWTLKMIGCSFTKSSTDTLTKLMGIKSLVFSCYTIPHPISYTNTPPLIPAPPTCTNGGRICHHIRCGWMWKHHQGQRPLLTSTTRPLEPHPLAVPLEDSNQIFAPQVVSVNPNRFRLLNLPGTLKSTSFPTISNVTKWFINPMKQPFTIGCCRFICWELY